MAAGQVDSTALDPGVSDLRGCFERIAGRFSLPGGGVHLVEATKQLYRPALRRAVRRATAPQLEEALEAAGAEAGLEGA